MTRTYLQYPILILIVGILGGLAGVVLQYLIWQCIAILYGSANVAATLDSYPWWLVILLPALGGLVTGLVVVYTRTPEIAGEGVPAITQALEVDASLIRYRVAFLKTCTTLATITTGGSAGREGPIIQIGAALGSLVAQIVRENPKRRETLLLSGAAAAMAATFGTPIAALVFVTEVLRRQMTLSRAVAILFSVISAIIVAQGVFGFEGFMIPVPATVTFDTISLLLAIVVGIVSGVVAVSFTYSLRYIRTLSKVRIQSDVWRPALGGLAVGFLLVWLPMLHEATFFAFSTTLVESASVSVWFIIAMLVAKIFATACTVGTGGSGGIFAPSLLLGVLVGALVTTVARMWGIEISSQLLVVGMAAVFAGAAHAPLTAVFMVYELSEITTLLPSLVLASSASYLTARTISNHHVYSSHT